MKNDRILPFAMSQQLSEADIQDISASGSSVATATATYTQQGGADINADITYDF